MQKFSEKSEEELQNLVEGAFRFTEQNSRHDTAKLMDVLLVIAERNRRHIETIERKNKIYTWLIIGLSLAAIIAQVLPLVSNRK